MLFLVAASMLFVGGPALALPSVPRPAWESSAFAAGGARRAVPTGADPRVPASLRTTPQGTGFQLAAVADRHRQRRFHRDRPGPRPAEGVLPPRRPHGLHLLGHRRGARPDRHALAPGRVPARVLARDARRAARSRPVRVLPGPRPHAADRSAGTDQHVRVRRTPADEGAAVAVHQLRRLVARWCRWSRRACC